MSVWNIEDGKGVSSPILRRSITSPAMGRDTQNEQTTQIYPTTEIHMPVFGQGKIQIIKSSRVIMAACQTKKQTTPKVRSLREMFNGDGRITIDPACMTPEMKKAVHRWV